MRITVPVKLVVKQAALDFDVETRDSRLSLEDHKEETVAFWLAGTQFLMEREELEKFLWAAGTFC